MNTIVSYLRLILFFGGVLVGIQVPVFVEQYGKSLTAHYAESQRSLEAFRDEAVRHFDGDMDRLIGHYRRSGDPVFQEGGDSLDALYRRHVLLRDRLADFRANPLRAYTQAFLTPVPDIQAEVRAGFAYAVKLDPGAMVFGLASGFVLSIVGEGLLRLMTALFLPPRSRRRPAP